LASRSPSRFWSGWPARKPEMRSCLPCWAALLGLRGVRWRTTWGCTPYRWWPPKDLSQCCVCRPPAKWKPYRSSVLKTIINQAVTYLRLILNPCLHQYPSWSSKNCCLHTPHQLVSILLITRR
jgi:hypothetical protein